MSNKNTIAKTIASQLGNRALVMLGAKNLMDTGKGLTFKIGRNASKITHITIELDPSDTYNVKFQRVWGCKVTDRGEFLGVYVDSLHSLIEAETGMYTSL